VRYQLRHAPGLRQRLYRRGGDAPRGTEYAPAVQRRALGVLFTAIAVSLALVAVWSALAGGRAWVIAFAAGALALWMGDLARRVWPW
jgi:hypothetical protein